MAIRVNPKLIDELEKYGTEDVTKCYHCGNCSAVCPHSKDPFVFPRRSMRLLQMGLEEKLKGSVEPWLCYYCGECSEQCPREAEPGETMMGIRRWLTSVYDFTGISRIFYRSWRTHVVAIILVALLTGAGFSLYGYYKGDINVYDGPGAFLPSHVVHIFDMILGGVLTIFLGLGAIRMWWLIIGRNKKIHVPVLVYISRLFLLPWHFFTQKRYAECKRKRPWFIHMVLVLSYVSMFILIMGFVHLMQEGPQINWRVHVLGYAASIGLLITTIYMLHGRLKKNQVQYKHSHGSDWIFLILLFSAVATGVVQHILHRTGNIPAANIAYVIHLMSDMPLLLLVVPFSKWSHMMYRPLAMYFADLYAYSLAQGQKNINSSVNPTQKFQAA